MDVREELPEFTKDLTIVVLDGEHSYITKTSISNQCTCPVVTSKMDSKYTLTVRSGVILYDLRRLLWWLDKERPRLTDTTQPMWFETTDDEWSSTTSIDWGEHKYTYSEEEPEKFEELVQKIQKGFQRRVYFTDGEDPRFDMDPSQTNPTTFVGVPSSFKLEYMVDRHGLTNDTKIVYIDVSPEALKYRKAMIEQWDGTDYSNFAYEYAMNNGLEWQIKRYRSEGDPDGRRRLESRCKVMFDVWGPGQFKRFWGQYRKAQHDFVNLNLITDTDIFLELIPNNSIVWWSNVFDYIHSASIYSEEQVLGARERLLERLSQKSGVTVYERWPEPILTTEGEILTLK
jgi:hypothetical protein